MHRIRCRWLLLCFTLVLAPAVSAQTNDELPLAELERRTGLLDLYSDDAKGRVLVGIRLADSPLLLVSGLPGALGSNEIGLDRNRLTAPKLVSFRRSGPNLLLVQHNTGYIADSTDAAERASVNNAFAEAVLWRGEVLAEHEGTLITDLSALLVSDAHGVIARLKATEQGDYKLDGKRSLALPEASRVFADNAEFEALITLTGPGAAPVVQQVAADPRNISLRQRWSFMRLPEPGYTSRAYHPASGGYSTSRLDFAQPLDQPIEQRLQPRFRLIKRDASAASSEVIKPIVFHLDRGTPEPVRSALLEGANWWTNAFEAAGLRNAFRAELQPADMDLMDLRVNAITWTHRATRGWSYGGGIIDPRTGEIVKGYVNLGSQRVRQDLLIAETLLAPFAADADPKLAQLARDMALARLRQLAAHEVGHAIGLAHNFAASAHGNGSVMDYPHPLVQLRENRIDLSAPYGVGVGPWDEYAIKHAYSIFPAASVDADLAALRADIRARGYEYVGDADARAPGDAHAAGLLWDNNADVIAGYRNLLAVRDLAMQNFGYGVLPSNRQNGELEARLVPLYLLHRYQAEGVARLIGGVYYRYGLADERSGTTLIDGQRQQQALSALLDAIDVQTLTVPERVIALLSPPANEYRRTPEYFAGRAGPVFDPGSAVESATALVVRFLLDPARLNRLHWQHQRQSAIPSVRSLIDESLEASWRHQSSAESNAAVAWSRNWVILDGLIAALEGGQLQPSVAASVRQSLVDLQRDCSRRKRGDQAEQYLQAADYIARYLADPSSVKIRPLPVPPPGAPI